MSDLIPAGSYEATALCGEDGAYAQIGETSNGNKQVVVSFEIGDGEQAGRRVLWFGFLTEKTWKRTIESLRYMGFKGDDLGELPTQRLDSPVNISVEHNEYDGKVSARVAWVNRHGSGTFKLQKPLAGNDLKLFAAKMKAYIRSVPEEQAAPRPNGAAPPSESDDVPDWL